jgi:hypothetical protein
MGVLTVLAAKRSAAKKENKGKDSKETKNVGK